MGYSVRKLDELKRPKGPVIFTGPREDCERHWIAGENAICWHDDSAPAPKRWPAETLGRVRRARLRTRLEKKHPLFADQLFNQEIAARAAYYEGTSRT